MQKKEQKITPSILDWCRYNIDNTFCGEIKYVRGKTYNYKSDGSLKKEIINLRICGKVFTKKYSDESRSGTPFDFVQIKNSPGYFFIVFKENNKTFYIIEVSQIQKEIESGSKSLTEARAKDICWRVGILK